MTEGLPPAGTADRARTPRGTAIRFLVVGRILGAVGVNGEMRVRLLTDFPERFRQLRTVHLGERLHPYPVLAARVENDTAVLKLAGVDDAAAAQALRGQDLHVPIEEAAPLEPDQYYWHQIVGLPVWTDDGRFLGRIREVLRTGSNDVYVVGSGGREVLLPAIEEVIRQVDLTHQKMIVHLLPGLVDERP